MAWSLANPFGIQIDNQTRDGIYEPAWHAGSVYDILSLTPGVILVATETGGVWHIDGSYNAKPLSHDWLYPDVECLAFGPLGAQHVMAGCVGGMYEANTASGHSFSAWTPVKLPASVTIVYRIVATQNPPRVAIATDAGVWWAPGRPLLSSGDPEGRYDWREAKNLAREEFFGLALSDGGIIVGVRNLNTSAKLIHGIHYGTWVSDLDMRAATLNVPAKDVGAMRAVSLASCRDNRSRAYAIAAGPDGKLMYVLRSDNGGRTWQPCPKTLQGNHGLSWDITNFYGDSAAGGWHKTISVHHQNPDVVGFGGYGSVLSKDGGRTWRGLGGDFAKQDDWQDDNRHQHHDVHACYFEPGFSDKRLYIASDGGVVLSEDWSASPIKFKSATNRNLANLQFYSPMEILEFWGTLGICDRQPLIGGGLQDNGNVWCQLRPYPQFWQKADGGDGGWVAFVFTPRNALNLGYDELVSNTMGEGVGRAVWNAPGFNGMGTIPLEPPIAGPGGGFDTQGLKGPMAEVVPMPKWATSRGNLMHAVGAAAELAAADLLEAIPLSLDGKAIQNRIVFGLFGNDHNEFLYWAPIGRLPTNVGRITALGTDTGYSVYAGTVDGKIFLIDAPTGQVIEMAVDPPPGGLGAIVRIVTHNQRGPFAVMRNASRSYLMKLDGGWREVIGTIPPPADVYRGFDIFRGGGPVSMAIATDAAIWISPDDGDSWFRSVSGLPSMPHCSDLRFGKLEGADMLFVGTWGWSVWMIGLEDLWELRERTINGPRHRKFLPKPVRKASRRAKPSRDASKKKIARGRKKQAASGKKQSKRMGKLPTRRR